MVRPWVGWLCILLFISIVFCLYLSINAPIIKNPYIISNNLDLSRNKELQKTFYYSTLNDKESFISHTKVKDCSTIHIAIVCAGYNSTVTLVTTVKSILFYRTKPLHFHLLVDEIALQTLNILFNTWNIPHVVISFYKSEEWIPQVSWIPNKHYSGVYGLLKLVLPDIIQESKILVLDTDVTILNDISLLWSLFKNFNEEQVLGLVENQSNWYIIPSLFSIHPWPALGKGFNTGVMLMDLQHLREKKFTKLWRSTTVTVLKDILETSLADQDIINAVIKNNPQFIYIINCTWNVQLSDHALSEMCYNTAEKINAIHWNSPRKQNVKNKYTLDFKQMHQIFLELDGNLLRRRLFGCDMNRASSQNNEMDPCFKFKEEGNIIYRTHTFYLEFEYNVINPVDVFLATQCSIDRMVLLEELSKHWPGVISIALYLTDAEVQSFLDFVHNSPDLRHRRNIAYHIVYKEGEFYPVNYLRNVAMTYITLPYIFQLDIDFLPQIGLYKNLMNYIIQQNLTESHHVALVVPAFETQRYRFSFPLSKTEVLSYLNHGILYTFRYHVWSQGHAPTNFTLYKNATEPYEISWEPDFEPYIVVSRSSPVYDTRFIGFGWNKVSYITHLTALGYKYIVLPDTFIIHRPHAPSRDIGKFRTNPAYRRCLKELKDTFVKDLLKKLGNMAMMNLKKIFTKDDKILQNITNK
ncbi:PREDICTED: glycosyltransferase-like protein LARGE1, partial [Ceratosolen solmsi marchali]|uniref:Glycosyltransferase-like protein LARGE1 n=1 Tax=Ceratosolen solmsi marchali TaxID=326594 RepID=A0AAJ7DWX4_9HYME